MTKKLRSNTGASLSVALLLFLVCAAVGAVLVTAGTAAVGRLSKLKELDQRYYSVTSAAQLVRDMMCEKEISFQQTKTTKTTMRNGIMQGAPVIKYKTEWVDPAGAGGTSGGMGLLELLAQQRVFGDSSGLETKAAWEMDGLGIEYVKETGTAGLSDGRKNYTLELFTMEPKWNGKKQDAMQVAAKAAPLGLSVAFVFENAASDAEGFRVQMNCEPTIEIPDDEIHVDTKTVVTGTYPDPNDAEGQIVTTETTETMTRIVNIEWKKKNCVITKQITLE